MTMLTLEDLKGMDENSIKNHIAEEYSGKESGFEYGEASDDEKSEKLKELEGWDILVAYESVGAYGCDSSSFFLLRKKDGDSYGIITGSHCSCFGFEGQGDIDLVDLAYLTNDKFYFSTGGYDDNSELNTKAVKEYMKGLSNK